MEEIYSKLQSDFGLGSKHILTLRSLENKDLGAKEICSKTQIPQGRIYPYLNFLVDNKLIEKTPKKPHVYSAKEFNKKVIEFMKKRIDSLLDSQSHIMDSMKGRLEQIEMIGDSRMFTFSHLNICRIDPFVHNLCSRFVVCTGRTMPTSRHPRNYRSNPGGRC